MPKGGVRKMIYRLRNRIAKSETEGGFTLIELLVAVVLIRFLLPIAPPSHRRPPRAPRRRLGRRRGVLHREHRRGPGRFRGRARRNDRDCGLLVPARSDLGRGAAPRPFSLS